MTSYECLTCGTLLEGETEAYNHTMNEHGQAGKSPEERFREV